MPAIALWFVGVGLLHLGHMLVRGLVEMLPEWMHHRDPPLAAFWLWGAGAAVYYATGRGLRRGSPVARVVACLLLTAWVVATLGALNAGTRYDWASQGPLYSAITESWRAVAWPGMLAHLGDFTWIPTGLWSAPEIGAAALVVALACSMAGVLLSPADLAAPRPRRPDSAPGAPATAPGNGVRARFEAALSIALILHLSLEAILTLVDVIGVSSKIAGSPG